MPAASGICTKVARVGLAAARRQAVYVRLSLQRPQRLWLLPAWLLLAFSCGCAGFWDDVTSRDFKVKSLFVKPSPFIVLHESNDGDQRAKALRALREPKQHGGSDQDQDAVVKILVTAATTEKRFLCRVAAIDALGGFKDPRAVAGLTDAFYNSGTFMPELANRLQCQALAALGATHNVAAVPFLVKVVKGAPATGTDQEKQQVMDVRIAAARALGGFEDYEAVEALVHILQNDKDVALCDCAFESLQHSTKQKLPPDYHDWDALLAKARQSPPGPPAASKFSVAAWFNPTRPATVGGTASSR
jgi:hypothetical protein